MALSRFKRVRSSNQEIADLSDSVGDFADQVVRIPYLNGVILKDVSLTTGVDNLIGHTLNRAYQGWILTAKSANANVWQEESDLPDRLLNLRSSANVTISLLVF